MIGLKDTQKHHKYHIKRIWHVELFLTGQMCPLSERLNMPGAGFFSNDIKLQLSLFLPTLGFIATRTVICMERWLLPCFYIWRTLKPLQHDILWDCAYAKGDICRHSALARLSYNVYQISWLWALAVVIVHLCRSRNAPSASGHLQIFLPEKGHHAKGAITIRDRTHFPHATPASFPFLGNTVL